MKTQIIFIAITLALMAPISADARTGGSTPKSTVQGGIPRNYRLSTVKVKGKVYYRTFRVTSRAGLARISDKGNGFRFFQGDGQYGEGFYLFRTRTDARKYARVEATHRKVARDVIAEVLLPKEKFDAVKKKVVNKDLDWSMQKGRNDPGYNKLRDLRLDSHLVMGKWAESPYTSEPMYKPLNGAKQIAVVQRGAPSILHEAIIRLHENYKPNK